MFLLDTKILAIFSISRVVCVYYPNNRRVSLRYQVLFDVLVVDSVSVPSEDTINLVGGGRLPYSSNGGSTLVSNTPDMFPAGA